MPPTEDFAGFTMDIDVRPVPEGLHDVQVCLKEIRPNGETFTLSRPHIRMSKGDTAEIRIHPHGGEVGHVRRWWGKKEWVAFYMINAVTGIAHVVVAETNGTVKAEVDCSLTKQPINKTWRSRQTITIEKDKEESNKPNGR